MKKDETKLNQEIIEETNREIKLAIEHKEKTRELNDVGRKNVPGRIDNFRWKQTRGFAALSEETRQKVMMSIFLFEDIHGFTSKNDPYDEHDFGQVEIDGEEAIYWKIDYYADNTFEYGADEPWKEETVRVLTIMLASEY